MGAFAATGLLYGLWYYKTSSDVFVSPLPTTVFGSSALENNPIIKDIKKALSKNNIAFSYVSFADSSYLILLSGGEEILFSQKKKIDEQVASLQLVLSRLTIEGKRFRRLDFRFDKPVITFLP